MHFSDLEIFDAHCDTLGKMIKNYDLKDTHFSFLKAKKYMSYIQTMAFCIGDEYVQSPFYNAIKAIEYSNTYKKKAEILLSKQDLNKTGNNKTAFLLAIEGGEAIEGSLEKLRILFSKGVRILTLTWNNKNEISDTALFPGESDGLTKFGYCVVKEMEKLGMAVDVSHISEKGFWDVLECASKPIIASHSCSKHICSHPRNLSDEQFIGISKNGGVVGINFYPLFLGGNKMEDILNHIFHFLSLGGENHIGFGSDFDGIPFLPEGMKSVADLDKLINMLLQENISEGIVRKIAYQNLFNYFNEILPEE